MTKLIRLGLAALLMVGGIWSSKILSNSVFADSRCGRGPSHEPSGPLRDIKTQGDLERWTTYYYVYPQPDLTVKAILVSEQIGFLDRPTAAAPLIGFFSQIFSQNPDKLPAWILELKPLKQNHKAIIYTALWLANTNESRKQAAILLKELAPDAQASITKSTAKVVPIQNMEICSPAVLDMLWTSFFATGDEKYVKRIISVLPWSQASEHNGEKKMVGYSAKWSLSSNAVQHKRVMAICLKERDKQLELRPILDDVIKQAKNPQVNK